MLSLRQKINFISKRISQKQLSGLIGSPQKYISDIKSGRGTGKTYEPEISEIYESLKNRKSPPTRKYSEGEVKYLTKDLKKYKKEFEIKPHNIRPLITVKKGKNKYTRLKYSILNIDFKCIPYTSHYKSIRNTLIRELSKYKIDIAFGNLYFKSLGMAGSVFIPAFHNIIEFQNNFYALFDNVSKNINVVPKNTKQNKKQSKIKVKLAKYIDFDLNKNLLLCRANFRIY